MSHVFFAYGPRHNDDGSFTPPKRIGFGEPPEGAEEYPLSEVTTSGFRSYAAMGYTLTLTAKREVERRGHLWASFDFRQLPHPLNTEDTEHRYSEGCRLGFPESARVKYRNTLSVVCGGWRSSRWTPGAKDPRPNLGGGV